MFVNVTLSVYPHRTSLKNMPGHGGNRTYDLWNTSPTQHRKNHMWVYIYRLAPSLSRMGFDRVYPVYYEISFELETENERDLKFVRSLQPGISIMFRSLLWFK